MAASSRPARCCCGLLRGERLACLRFSLARAWARAPAENGRRGPLRGWASPARGEGSSRRAREEETVARLSGAAGAGGELRRDGDVGADEEVSLALRAPMRCCKIPRTGLPLRLRGRPCSIFGARSLAWAASSRLGDTTALRNAAASSPPRPCSCKGVLLAAAAAAGWAKAPASPGSSLGRFMRCRYTLRGEMPALAATRALPPMSPTRRRYSRLHLPPGCWPPSPRRPTLSPRLRLLACFDFLDGPRSRSSWVSQSMAAACLPWSHPIAAL
jgi:hypothetical protein